MLKLLICLIFLVSNYAYAKNDPCLSLPAHQPSYLETEYENHLSLYVKSVLIRVYGKQRIHITPENISISFSRRPTSSTDFRMYVGNIAVSAGPNSQTFGLLFSDDIQCINPFEDNCGMTSLSSSRSGPVHDSLGRVTGRKCESAFGPKSTGRPSALSYRLYNRVTRAWVTQFVALPAHMVKQTVIPK